MNYPSLKAKAPSSRSVAFLGASALLLVTIASGIVGSDAFARTVRIAKDRYAIRASAVRSADSITVQGIVTDNTTNQVVASPKVTLDSSRRATMKSTVPGFDVVFEISPDAAEGLAVEVSIEKGGDVVQKARLLVAPSEAAAAGSTKKFEGEPLSLTLKDADLRDVIQTFGKLTGLQMQLDESVQGKVSVSWHDVPWDEAFDTVLKENGMTYRIEGKTVTISRK